MSKVMQLTQMPIFSHWGTIINVQRSADRHRPYRCSLLYNHIYLFTQSIKIFNAYNVLVCELDAKYMEINNLKIPFFTITMKRQITMGPFLSSKRKWKVFWKALIHSGGIR